MQSNDISSKRVEFAINRQKITNTTLKFILVGLLLLFSISIAVHFIFEIYEIWYLAAIVSSLFVILCYYNDRHVSLSWTILASGIVFFLDGYIGEGAGIHLYYFPIILMTSVLGKQQNGLILVLNMSIPIICFAASLITRHSLFLNPSMAERINILYLYYTNIVVNVLTLEAFVLFVLFKNYHSRKLKRGSDAKVKALLDTNDGAICIINRNYEIVDFNKCFASFYQERECQTCAIHENVFTLFGKNKTLTWVKRFHKAMRGYNEHYIECDYLNGQEIYLDINISPIFEGKAITAIAIFTKDITLQRVHEERLKKQSLELKKLNKALDRFVYSASHDLRSPIASMLGLINIAKRENELEKIRECLQMKEKTLKRLDGFIQDIVNYSTNARLVIQREKINFNEMIVEIFEQHYFDEAPDRELRPNITIVGEIPFFTDKKRLSVILGNLISNAIRYSDDSKAVPTIKISVCVNGDFAQIFVEDNGLGIEEEHIDRIYDMFYQAHTHNHGSGLGLYVVKETLEKLDGHIKVSSTLAVGTSFEVTLPNLGPDISSVLTKGSKLTDFTFSSN